MVPDRDQAWRRVFEQLHELERSPTPDVNVVGDEEWLRWSAERNAARQALWAEWDRLDEERDRALEALLEPLPALDPVPA